MVNNKSFEQYQHIIDEFRGRVKKPDFERKFADATSHLPKSERFLLKMEIKRLANPCTRLVDLRGHVNGECKAYEHEGRIHYLDDVAIKVFEENLAHYGGYTFGVYDAVMNTENNFRVMYQKEKAQALAAEQQQTKTTEKSPDKLFYPASFFSTRVYHNRFEERMNFAVPVLVMLDENEEIEAVTSDISAHGCKLKVPANAKLHLEQMVSIRFTGLEQEFQFGKNNRFSYQVCNISLIDNVKLVGFKRCDIAEKDSFLQFLSGFIQGNKRRYKINLDNTIEAIQARTYEQFAVPKIAELPVFLSQEKQGLVPKYALTCQNNQNIYQYWLNERGQQTLAFLLNTQRIEAVKQAAELGRNLLVYCFVHQTAEHKYFYTADEQQLRADKALGKQFLAFAANKSGFKVFSLKYHTVVAERGYSPFTLSNAIQVKDEYLNQPLSDEVKGILASLPGMITVVDLTSENIQKDYLSLTQDEINTAQIRQFGHKYSKIPLPRVDEVGLNYRNQRQEPRFIYSTPVQVTQGKKTFNAQSDDFSISGIRITLAEPQEVKKGEILLLSFPKLQQITTSFSLKNLKYEVVRVNKSNTVVNLKVFVEKHQHVGRSFFKLLIDKNHDKLKTDEYALMIPGLSKALRNIYSRSMVIPSLVVQSSGSRYKTEVVVASEQISPLFAEMEKLSERPGFFNLYPLLCRLTDGEVSDAQLKKMLPKDLPVATELYIALNHKESKVDKAVIVKLGRELDSPQLKKMFIKRALKNGQFFCVKLVLSRTEPPDMGHLNPELAYIGSYAIHRAKQLEQQIWSVAGVIRVYDMTDEAMYRYQLLN